MRSNLFFSTTEFVDKKLTNSTSQNFRSLSDETELDSASINLSNLYRNQSIFWIQKLKISRSTEVIGLDCNNHQLKKLISDPILEFGTAN